MICRNCGTDLSKKMTFDELAHWREHKTCPKCEALDGLNALANQLGFK